MAHCLKGVSDSVSESYAMSMPRISAQPLDVRYVIGDLKEARLARSTSPRSVVLTLGFGILDDVRIDHRGA